MVEVARTGEGHRLVGGGGTVEAANAFLGHLGVRGYSPATVRAYAFDIANFATFLAERGLALSEVVASDLFGYLDWQQQQRRPSGGGKVVPLAARGPSPATMNRRISAVRGLFEHQVMAGALDDNPCRQRVARTGCAHLLVACWDTSLPVGPAAGDGWFARPTGCRRASTAGTSRRSLLTC